MEPQLFNYWNYMASSYQNSLYNLPPDVSEVPGLSESPASRNIPYWNFHANTAKGSIINDSFPAPVQQAYLPLVAGEQTTFGAYSMSISPSDFGSDQESPKCSPNPLSSAEPEIPAIHPTPAPAERTLTTSGRRRAQNRAAQRAFRERKEKHARDLEAQLSVMNEKYNKLEALHSELNIAHEKLRRTVELLTQHDVDAEGEDENGQMLHRRSGNSETLRKLLEILHGEFKAPTPVKVEEF